MPLFSTRSDRLAPPEKLNIEVRLFIPESLCPCGWLKAILAQCKVGTAAAGIVIIGPKRFYAKS